VNYTKHICPICSSRSLKDIDINLPTFRHIDFSTVSNRTLFKRCLHCNVVFNPNLISNELSVFKSKKYSESCQTHQKIKHNNICKSVTRSTMQAKLIYEDILPNNKFKVLDIGCFDGDLLNEISKLSSRGEYWGFDINSDVSSLFPKGDKFNFIDSSLSHIYEKFDLIILSHSILYIHNFSLLMSDTERLLKKDGTLYIQIPDISKNTHYSLMGDQLYIFTKDSLINSLRHYGFSEVSLNGSIFPREVVISARKDDGVKLIEYIYEDIFSINMLRIKDSINKLRKIKNDKISVLGSTVNAAFVDEVIGNKIEFFVDENYSINKKYFRGKPVYHPSKLNQNNLTVIPYQSDIGISIKDRFIKTYKGNFEVL